MPRARLIRRVRFRAAHRYWRVDWSEAENRRAFGAQADAHDHDWVVEVHVSGPVDARTGWAADLASLDAALADLTGGWDGGDLNALVPPVADGTMTPSTENLARWLFEELHRRIDEPARVVEVRVFESPDLGGAYPA
jgi:6-pyruvoyltetrahydropterin/6-carboxytetrahydropterin synthase